MTNGGFPEPGRTARPIVERGFPPILPTGADMPGGGIVGKPVFDRAPRSQEILWYSADQADDAGGFFRLDVDYPTLVKVLNTTDPLTGSAQVDLDLFWKTFGEPGAEVDGFYGSDPSKPFYRNAFVGPFAYLPRPGQYEIYAVTGQVSNAPLPMRAQILQNFSPQEWQALVTSNGCRVVEFSGGTLLAGVPSNGGLQAYQSFPQFRSMIVDNTGANSLSIRVGDNTAGAITVAAGASFEITEPYLGRGTVWLVSTAGTTFRIAVALW